MLGGGPGGYEAALVAAQLGADVTVVDRDGLGGACVLTDCVPSKALIATADARTRYVEQVGTGSGPRPPPPDLAEINAQIKALAHRQSEDVARPAGQGRRHGGAGDRSARGRSPGRTRRWPSRSRPGTARR